MQDTTTDFDRRQFAARLATGAAALAALLPDDVAAQDKPAKPEGEKPAAPFNPIAMQLEMLVNLYPSEKLTEEGLRMIAGKLAGQWANSARLASVPLTNADGPGFVFSAYRAAEEK